MLWKDVAYKKEWVDLIQKSFMKSNSGDVIFNCITAIYDLNFFLLFWWQKESLCFVTLNKNITRNDYFKWQEEETAIKRQGKRRERRIKKRVHHAIGNCDIRVKQKISLKNKMKWCEILPRPKGWV